MILGKLRSVSVVLGSIAVAIACSVQSVDDAREQLGQLDEQLTGGRVALESEYPSTVHFGFCTGAKVGPRHFLLAAHCVHDSFNNTVSGGFAPGFSVALSTDNLNPSGDRILTIEQTTIFPEWLSSCDPPCGVNVLDPSHAPDIAVIVVTQETPDIPAASIDPTPVLPGERVTITGYGCEDGLNRPSPAGPRLKIQEVGALAKEALLHSGSFVTDDQYATDIAGSYVVTPGFFENSGAASLCPGDSGGPLYRESTTELALVGVNAYYTFKPESDGVSFTNWHTRVDGSSRYPVLSWLRGLGVNVKGTGPQTISLQAEDFATGGEGVGYHDTDASNNGGKYRTSEGVDIQMTTDVGGGFNVGWTAAGEWLKYPINVATAGTYKLDLRIATTATGKKLRVEVDGTNVSGSLTAPNTNGWQSWTTLHAPDVALSAGNHTVRVFFETNGFNLNWLSFTPVASSPSCTDNVKNGSETDVDCGGSCTTKCANGKTCSASSDCSSGNCVSGVCQAAVSCTDGIKNGSESDIDCGGSCTTKCANGKTCSVSSDCSSTNCVSGVCQAQSTGNCSAPAWSSSTTYSSGQIATAVCQVSIPGTACFEKIGKNFAWRCDNPSWCSLQPGSNSSGWWSAWTSVQQCN